MANWLDSILNSDLTFIYILRAIAIILVTIGFGSLITTILFLSRSTRAEGQLVAWEILRSHDIRKGAPSMKPNERPTYRAVVAFTAADGAEHRVTGNVWTSKRGKPTLPIGHPLPVRYTPGNPDDARIATIVNLWFMPVVCSIIGSFLMYLWLH